MTDIKYPIYKLSAAWDQEGFDNNSISFFMMYKEKLNEESLNTDLKKFKEDIFKKYKVLTWHNFGYEFIEDESWCLNWFGHYTFNDFETDEEVEQSFDDFIKRKEELNWKNGHQRNERADGNENPFYCSMGADDRWRWKICRCEHCKEQGVIRIDH